MDQHRLETDDDDVGVQHRLRKAQHEQHAQHGDARDQQFDDMQARARQPVQRARAVMHRMEAPHDRHLVIHPAVDEEVDAQQHRTHRQVVEQEVLHVHLPLAAEHRLARVERRELLENDEDRAGRQQIQDEPVQTKIGLIAGIVRRHHDLATAGRHGAADQHEGGDIQPALAAQHGIGQRDRARDKQRPEQQGAHRVHGVERAQFRRGQVGRKVEGQHAQHRQDRQEERDHAAHHPCAGVDTSVLSEEFKDLPIDRHALFHVTFMADHGEASVSPGGNTQRGPNVP
ncbi:hypothetical protein G6F22_014653 [Rhizopus arrhizus]|nr:hypothetical protein G6F22_014653 [Rhizopus arrhizus]